MIYEDVKLCDIVNLLYIYEDNKRSVAFLKTIGFGCRLKKR